MSGIRVNLGEFQFALRSTGLGHVSDAAMEIVAMAERAATCTTCERRAIEDSARASLPHVTEEERGAWVESLIALHELLKTGKPPSFALLLDGKIERTSRSDARSRAWDRAEAALEPIAHLFGGGGAGS